jgi:hypothetical protein
LHVARQQSAEIPAFFFKMDSPRTGHSPREVLTMRSPFSFFTLSFLVAAPLLTACGGSTLDTAPGTDDSGADVSHGDGTTDAPGDTTPGGDSTSDVVADTSPPPDDTTPPPVDARPDVVGDSGGGPCDPSGGCSALLKCCAGACVYEQNDPLNCGGCGVVCSGETSMCEGGHCIKPTCAPACGAGQSCCQIDGPGPSGPPRCVDGPTCPIGCPLCG